MRNQSAGEIGSVKLHLGQIHQSWKSYEKSTRTILFAYRDNGLEQISVSVSSLTDDVISPVFLPLTSGMDRHLLPRHPQCSRLHPGLWHLLFWQLWIRQDHASADPGDQVREDYGTCITNGGEGEGALSCNYSYCLGRTPQSGQSVVENARSFFGLTPTEIRRRSRGHLRSRVLVINTASPENPYFTAVCLCRVSALCLVELRRYDRSTTKCPRWIWKSHGGCLDLAKPWVFGSQDMSNFKCFSSCTGEHSKWGGNPKYVLLYVLRIAGGQGKNSSKECVNFPFYTFRCEVQCLAQGQIVWQC